MFRRKKSKDKTGSRRPSITEEEAHQEVIKTMFSTPDNATLQYIHERKGILDPEIIKLCQDVLLRLNKKYCDEFMQQIAPKLTNEELFNLTNCLMRSHVETKQTEPLLRGTDLLTGALYAELARRCHYDPSNPKRNELPMMDVLNHHVYKSVLYKIRQDGKTKDNESTKQTAANLNGSVATVILVKLDPYGINDPNHTAEYMKSAEYIEKVMKFQQENREMGRGNSPEIVDPLINARVTGETPPRLGSNYNYEMEAYPAGEQPWLEADRATTPARQSTQVKFSMGAARKASDDKGKGEAEPEIDKGEEQSATTPKTPPLEKSAGTFFKRGEVQEKPDVKPDFKIGRRGPGSSKDK